jgi:hypothetical protein
MIFSARKILSAQKMLIGPAGSTLRATLPHRAIISYGVRLDEVDSEMKLQTQPGQALQHPVSRQLSAAIYFHDLSPGGVER